MDSSHPMILLEKRSNITTIAMKGQNEEIRDKPTKIIRSDAYIGCLMNS
jgi:hypothetical protein